MKTFTLRKIIAECLDTDIDREIDICLQEGGLYKIIDIVDEPDKPLEIWCEKQ